MSPDPATDWRRCLYARRGASHECASSFALWGQFHCQFSLSRVCPCERAPDGVGARVVRMKGPRYLVQRRVHRWRSCNQRTDVRTHPDRNDLAVVSYNNVLPAVRVTVEVPGRDSRPFSIPLLAGHHGTTKTKRRESNCMDIQLSVQRLLLGAAIAVISLGTQGAELVGQVVAVADGDTLTVLDGERRQYRVRLQAIDAPEKGQDYWRVSKQSLADRVFSQFVTIEYEKKDRYGRLVGRVLRDGRDINYEMRKSKRTGSLAARIKLSSGLVLGSHSQAEAGTRAVESYRYPLPCWCWRLPLDCWMRRAWRSCGERSHT